MIRKKLIINADDLGFTKGINQAIKEAHLGGFLSHASLMANANYFDDAVYNVIANCPKLKIGVHVNLTCGNSLVDGSFLANNGVFQNSFMKFLFIKKSPETLALIEQEIESQIIKIKNLEVEISHIDGHEHVHIIPSINKIIRKLARKYHIPRVREINENTWQSIKFNAKTTAFVNYIKLFLLKTLSTFNQNDGKVKFYSILNTCEINSGNLFNYLQHTKDEEIEIMLHPGLIEMDANEVDLDQRFVEFLRSPYRTQEFELCFNKEFENYVSGK